MAWTILIILTANMMGHDGAVKLNTFFHEVNKFESATVNEPSLLESITKTCLFKYIENFTIKN